LSLCRDLAIDGRNAPHFLYAASGTQCNDLEHKCITGKDRLSEFCAFDAAKEWNFRVAIFEFAKGKDRTDLSKSLDLQNARHDWRTGKMPGKERLIERNLLDADDARARFEFDYLIDKQEWESVGKDLLNGDRVVNYCHLLGRFSKSA